MDRTSHYFAEFEQLGVAAVKKQLSTRRWNREKLAAARQWIDRQDVGQWAERHSGPAKVRVKKGQRKWMMILVAVAGALFFGIRFLQGM